jgi:hypothetical protein
VAHGTRNFVLDRASRRIPFVRRIPIIRLLFIAELALVAGRHVQHLTPDERRRLAALVRKRRELTPSERDELRDLVGKLDPRAFAGSVVDRVSPLPLPRRLTRKRY